MRSKQKCHIKKPLSSRSLSEKRRDDLAIGKHKPGIGATCYLFGGHSSLLHVSTAVGIEGTEEGGNTRRNRGVGSGAR